MRAITFLAAAALVLTGCYSSSIPLGTVEQAEFDPALLGTWYTDEPDSNGTPDELVVRRIGEREYELLFTSTAFSTHPTTERVEGYVVRVNGVPFLNVLGVESDEENDERKWIFFRYELLGTDGLQLWSLKDDIEVEPAASDLRAFVERNLHRPDIYTDAVRFQKRAS